MVHKFNSKGKHKLDNEKRREALPAYQTLNDLGLSQGDIMADIGCGIGYFSLPAAEIVGDTGKIYALDISIEMIEELERKIEGQSTVIRTIVTEENDLKLEDNSVNYGFLCTVLHEVENISQFLKEAKRILMKDGRLVIVEWKKEESDYGPPIGRRLDQQEALDALKNVGFTNIIKTEVGQHFYGLIAKL